MSKAARSPCLAALVLLLLLVTGCGPGGSETSGRRASTESPPHPTYVGRDACARCHPRESELWKGSHHDLAMEEATEQTVLGDFDGASYTYAGVTSTFFRKDGKYLVRTDGPVGKLADYEVAYTFGVEPLQQYLVAFPGGRFQASSLAWDSRPAERGGQKWFHLYPGERIDFRDPLHWTKRYQNWNVMCAECHSTNLEKRYLPESDRYETRWSEIDVSCEACHGPGSRHVAWGETEQGARPTDVGLTVDLSDRDGAVWLTDVETGLSRREPPRSTSSRVEVETCAPCHSRRSSSEAPDEIGRPLLDTHRPALLRDPLYFSDGQIEDEVYVYGSFLQSKMYRKGVTCKDCHDPHALRVRGEENAVCAVCHLSTKFDTPAHHFHASGTPGAACVSCHMPTRTYMVIDARRDHSFRIPRPDLSIALGTPNACNGCHGDKSPEWARAAIVRWYGEDVRPHFGVALDAARRGLAAADEKLEGLIADKEVPAIARATALEMMGENPSERAPSILEGGFSDEDPLVRYGALESASLLPPPERHRAVYPLLSDPVRMVRFEAALALSSVPAELFTPDQKAALDRVIGEYRDGQLRNADWPESRLNLGNLHLARGELDEARKAYEAAIRIAPEFPRAYVNLADLYRTRGDDLAAERVLREGLERVPDDPDVHHALGLALVRLKRTDEAVAELGRAAALRPEEPRYSYAYALALSGQGNVSRAIEVLRGALTRHPQDRDLLYALATLYRDAGDSANALAIVNELIALRPDDAAPRALLRQIESGAR
jgi:tetratricopeptide (TPR) repeat protein